MLFPDSDLNTIFKSFSLYKGIISIWGDFGVGKTTFALQTAMNTIRNENKIIYIYSKPNFPAEKIRRLARGSMKSLNNIIFIQTKNFEDMHNIVFNLEFLILNSLNITKEKYKLIVIDSLTDLYRLALNKEKKEKNYNLNYTLNQVLANLLNINNSYNIDILIVNEKVNKLINNQTIEMQGGGKVMEYWVSANIKIERTEVLKERKFILTKRPEIQNMEFKSSLTKNGFQ
jgi:RecA/RadA recombinase